MYVQDGWIVGWMDEWMYGRRWTKRPDMFAHMRTVVVFHWAIQLFYIIISYYKFYIVLIQLPVGKLHDVCFQIIFLQRIFL